MRWHSQIVAIHPVTRLSRQSSPLVCIHFRTKFLHPPLLRKPQKDRPEI